MSRVEPGQTVWKTDDPAVTRRVRKTFTGRPQRRVALDIEVEAAVGQSLKVSATAESGARCRVESAQKLEEARRYPLTEEVLKEQLGRLGGTVYELRRLGARIDGRPMLPLSLLGQVRHEMIRQLDEAGAVPPHWTLASESPLTAGPVHAAAVPLPDAAQEGSAGNEHWHILCRSLRQLDEVLVRGETSVTADFCDIEQCGDAVELARRHGAEILLATPRIQKPGEAAIFERLADFRPDGLLVRNLAGAAFCAERCLAFVADASLHAANPWTVACLRDLGAERVTAAYDLDRQRLLELAVSEGPSLEVIVYQHLPMFHTEHCVYCAALAPDRSGEPRGRNCGRPCRRHDVRLRDRLGVEHPLRADACCRNTLFHAQPQNLASLAPSLRRCGVRHFRVELLDLDEKVEWMNWRAQ
jgi:putative protease